LWVGAPLLFVQKFAEEGKYGVWMVVDVDVEHH